MGMCSSVGSVTPVNSEFEVEIDIVDRLEQILDGWMGEEYNINSPRPTRYLNL